jgi:hypothetical protein
MSKTLFPGELPVYLDTAIRLNPDMIVFYPAELHVRRVDERASFRRRGPDPARQDGHMIEAKAHRPISASSTRRQGNKRKSLRIRSEQFLLCQLERAGSACAGIHACRSPETISCVLPEGGPSCSKTVSSHSQPRLLDTLFHEKRFRDFQASCRPPEPGAREPESPAETVSQVLRSTNAATILLCVVRNQPLACPAGMNSFFVDTFRKLDRIFAFIGR